MSLKIVSIQVIKTDNCIPCVSVCVCIYIYIYMLQEKNIPSLPLKLNEKYFLIAFFLIFTSWFVPFLDTFA